MILFPIALIWLVVVAVWLIRNSIADPDLPDGDTPSPRRFRPRRPRSPHGGPARSARRETARKR
ncbi:MAG TPA: hypothetical protein VG265_12425 [Gaiellaceae bacterium]|nr:hypothetical protein [Gaiellaceae bacterium]